MFKSPCLISGCVCEERSDVGGGQAGGVGGGEEVAEALLGQVAVLVVVEGLTRQLAEEVAAVQGDAGAVVLLQGAARRREGLRAAAAAETAEGGTRSQLASLHKHRYFITHADSFVC